MLLQMLSTKEEGVHGHWLELAWALLEIEMSNRRPVWAKCYYLQYIHASVRSLNDLLICHMCAKSHVLLEIFAKTQNSWLRQTLAKYYY